MKKKNSIFSIQNLALILVIFMIVSSFAVLFDKPNSNKTSVDNNLNAPQSVEQ